MSATQPASKTELKEYCLKRLGAPVIDINVSDEQMDQLIEDSIQLFQEYHFDGTEVFYAKEKVAPSTLTVSGTSGTFEVGEIVIGATSNASATVYSVDSSTVLKVHRHKNPEGIREADTTNTFSSGETITGGTSGATATFSSIVFGNVDTKALTLDDTIIGLFDVLPISQDNLSSNDMFSFEYQFHLNEIPYLMAGGTLSHYVTTRQYMSLLNEVFSGKKPMRFNRLTDKVYIEMDWEQAVKIGDVLILKCYKKINGDTYPELYNDIFLKKYTTALFKRQWGMNMIKYDGIQLPGGVTLNGRQIYDDAQQEIEKLEEEMSLRYELPLDFYVG